MAITEKNTVALMGENEFELPVGYTDRNGVLHKVVRLKEMTGKVDEAMADKKVRTNAGKMITELILGVVESLGTLPKVDRNIVRQLSNADRDFIVLMNHLYSIGETMEYVDVCNSCGNKLEVAVDIPRMPVTYMSADEPRLIHIEDLPNGFKDDEGNVYKDLTLMFPNGMVQEKVFSTFDKNPQQAITQVIAMCTEKISGFENYRFDVFQNLTKKDRKYINEKLTELKVGVDLQVEVECTDCGHNFKSPIPLLTLTGE